MKDPKQIYTRVLGRDFELGPELAVGGEGRIYAIKGHSKRVAKIFHRPSSEKAAKLSAMLAHPPHDPTLKKRGHISIAWPTALILNAKGECVGFTMPYIERSKSFPLLKIYNPRDRQRMELNFTWEYLLYVAHNLAYLLAELHASGYVIGDLNESNILVTVNAEVTLVDCDSIQVPKERQLWEAFMFRPKQYFRCTVGKPEYTAPELQGRRFSEVNRTPDHDNFALAVIIFLLLMEGRHPYAGVWQGKGEPPTLEQSMRSRDFPYGDSGRLIPPKRALPLYTLPPHLQTLMLECFGPRSWLLWFQQRPTAYTWKRALENIEGLLVHCPKNYSHIYSEHLNSCPWCERMQLGLPDPFLPTLEPMKTRRRSRNIIRFLFHIASVCLIPLSIALYGIEIFFWPLYNHWLTHAIWQVAGILWLLLLVMPIVIYFSLAQGLKKGLRNS
jgi:DNA-binding helix-hairpin-helix protein with protein kinase domain